LKEAAPQECLVTKISPVREILIIKVFFIESFEKASFTFIIG
jgi:hypothetical protein